MAARAVDSETVDAAFKVGDSSWLVRGCCCLLNVLLFCMYVDRVFSLRVLGLCVVWCLCVCVRVSGVCIFGLLLIAIVFGS